MSQQTTSNSAAEASRLLPQLTKTESYLAAFEDDELLPIIANKKPSRTERERLGLAQNRLGGGSLALHDELGEQLAGVSPEVLYDLAGEQSAESCCFARFIDVSPAQAQRSSLFEIVGRRESHYRIFSRGA